MGIWDRLRGELIDIIEWLDPTSNTMVHRFERYNNEIKYGAKLVVREGQAAVFVNEGQIADVFKPGTYELETKNLPILSTLMGWKYGFESPFKAEVYFASTRRFTDLKWGTKNPVMLRDKEFGPVRLRAFGTYVMRVNDPAAFIREIVGTEGRFTTEDITAQLRNMIVSRFVDILGESGIPVLDLAANYDELGQFITQRIQDEFKVYGLELTKMLVENISLPPAVEAALDKRTSMGVIGNLQQYTQYQTAEAIREAAQNEGGGTAGAGMGMGMGFAMANQMGKAMAGGMQPQPGAAPPPLPQAAAFFVAINNQQSGPFDHNALQQYAASGQLTRETLVWKQGMPNWIPAGQVPDLQSLFASAPPPLPPKG
ncbi:MAG: SPFH domain-containing protein [Phycisphaerae bacterium]|nr:SPFH domain-containing protein [Phycisphaerae bacterium]